jgi:hypothetical protein
MHLFLAVVIKKLLMVSGLYLSRQVHRVVSVLIAMSSASSFVMRMFLQNQNTLG